MEKKRIVLIIVLVTAIFLWLFFVGQLTGTNGVYGDINLIDEGQFSAWINHMLNGEKMYVNFFLQYGPLQVYLLYLMVKVFGPSFAVVRFYGSVFGVFFGILVALFTLIKLKVQPMLAVVTGLFLILYPGVNIRFWIGILCILFALLSNKKKSAFLWFVTGVLIAVSLLQSIEVGAFAGITIAGYGLYTLCFKKFKKKTAWQLSFALIGFILTVSVFSIWAFREGWLFDYVVNTYNFVTVFSGMNLPNGIGLPDFFLGTHSNSPLGIFALVFSKTNLFYWLLMLMILFQTIIIIRFILRVTTYRDTMVFLILCFTFISYFSIIGRSGHSLFYAPIILLCSGYFLTLLLEQVKNGKASRYTAIIFILFFSFFILRFINIFKFTSFFNPGLKTDSIQTVPRISPLAISKTQAQEILDLQKFFNDNSSKNDEIFVINNLPALYFLLDRKNPTQYDLPLLAILKEDRLELIKELEKSKPKFMVEDTKAWKVDGISDRMRMPEVSAYIDGHYSLTARIRSYLIYRINK